MTAAPRRPHVAVRTATSLAADEADDEAEAVLAVDDAVELPLAELLEELLPD